MLGLFSWFSTSSRKNYTVEVYEDGKLDQVLSVEAENGFDAVDKVADNLPPLTSRRRRIKCLNCIPH